MFTLGQLATSDFELLGAISEDELLGALERAPLAERKQFIRRVKNQSQKVVAATAAPANSRGEFEKRMPMLPKEIQTGLASKNLQVVDAAYYVTKNVSASKIAKMLKDDDNKVIAQSNISSAKLEKGNMMLLSGIILLAGVAEQGKTVGDVTFDFLPAYIRNGEFEFKANGTTLIPSTSCEVFNTAGMTIRKGLFRLDNPKIINDQQAMELNLEWSSNAVDNTFIKAILIGTSVTKY